MTRHHPAFALLGILAAHPVVGQEDSLSRAGLMVVSQRGAVAQWLVQYDAVAWISSDSVVQAADSVKARLGEEWFADTLRGQWHAFYGRYDPGTATYRVVLHYAGPTPRRLHSSLAAVDTNALTRTARALYESRKRLPAGFAPSGLRLNQYVRRIGPDTLEVWLLPAFQPNGIMVYGSEAVYRWNTSTRTLLDSSLVQAPYRGLRPDSTVNAVLDASHSEYPTVGQLFFLLSYHRYFAKLAVRSQRLYTTVFVGPDGPALVSAVRDSVRH